MCAKDESEKMRETLAQVIHLADELVIGIDETSTDDTWSIANSYADRVGKLETYRYKWKDDFSAMRNECLKHSSQDLVLMIDGHDFIEPSSIKTLEKILSSDFLPDHVNVIDGIMQDPVHEDGSVSAYMRPMVFRRLKNGKGQAGTEDGVHFELPIHNVIGEERKSRLFARGLVSEHRQPPERQKTRKAQRKGMNVAGLKQKIEDDPNDARSIFYLARTYDEMGDTDEAEKWFLKHLDVANFPDEEYQSKMQLAVIHIRRFEKTQNQAFLVKAKKIMLTAFEQNIPRNDHVIMLGDIARAQNSFPEAAHWYRIAAAYKEPYVFLFVMRNSYQWLPWERLAVACANFGQFDEGIAAIRKALEYRPQETKYYSLLAQLTKAKEVQ